MRPIYHSMKKFALLPLALLCAVGTALADDQLRNVQTELKSLGFFYGEVSGQPSSETTSAIRRYQIRNGLDVTGSLNAETLAALGMGPKAAPKGAAEIWLFPADEESAPLELRSSETFKSGVLNLSYAPAAATD